MAELLLVNPRKRRAPKKARKANRSRRRRNPVSEATQRARRSNSTISRARRRRRNPVALSRVVRRRHAFSGISRHRRRRRNPIGGRLMKSSIVASLVSMAKEAAIGAAGAIAVDVAMGQANRFIPASLQRTPGKVGVGDAVKAAITVVLAKLLAKSTKGLSVKMGLGALTVQAHQIMAGFVPSSLTLGYAVPGRVVQGSNRVGPMRNVPGMNAYVPAGSPTPLLNAYVRAGSPSPLLSSVGGARRREGAVR